MTLHLSKLILKKLVYDNHSAGVDIAEFEDVLENSGYKIVRLSEGYHDP